MQQQAAEYLAQFQYKEAIAIWERSLAADPGLISHYWYLGLGWFLLGETVQAETIWLSALAQINPAELDDQMVDLLGILRAEAKRHLEQRKFKLAQQLYEQIIDFDFDQVEAHYYLGCALSQQGDFYQAIACWETTINLNPSLVEVYLDLAELLQKLTDFEGAITYYLKILELPFQSPDIYYNLGWCFWQVRNAERAIACWETAITIKSDYATAYADLGYIWLTQGKIDEAIDYWQKSLQIAEVNQNLVFPKQINDIMPIGFSLINLLNSPDKQLNIYLYLGKILAREHHFDLAIASFQKALQLQCESAELYLEMGKAFAKQEDFESAIAVYQKAIQLEPNGEENYLELGKIYAHLGNHLGAIALYEKALQINPNIAEVYFCLGLVLATSGRWEEAISYYQKVLHIQPNYVDAYCNLGIALAELGRITEAIASFRTLIEINPDLAQALDQLMILLCEQGKLDRQTLVIHNILPIEPPNSFYETTKEWAISGNLETTNYLPIYPENIIDLTPPHTPEETIHFSFRFGDQMKLPASFVTIIPNGRFWLNKTQSSTAIITTDQKILGDLSLEFPVLSPGHPDQHPSKHSIFSLGKLPPIQKIDGTVVVLAGLLNNVYFHWMLDILPRLQLLYNSEIELGKIDQFLVSNQLSFQTETLNNLGIPESKIIAVDQYHHIQANRLIVPSFPGTIAWMPKWTCEFLRHHFLDQQAIDNSEKIEHLYISRKLAANRRIINEDEVIKLLENYGFKSVNLESMSVKKQAALLANAKVIVAAHGSGLTNTIFCQERTKLIEIFSPNYVYHCYWWLSNLVDLEYYYLLGEIPTGVYLHKLIYPSPINEDIFVNLEKLLKIMKFAQVF